MSRCERWGVPTVGRCWGLAAVLKYEPKIDGLRAISILLVIFHHWFSQRWETGYIGVTVFFVISGYLITGIIAKEDDSGASLKARALDFYWRRALRLFPPYYVCLLLLAVFNVEDIRQTIWWNATYTTNIEVALNNAWNGTSHFWSLAVEEQFYLVWFFLMAVLRGRARMAAVLICLMIGPAFRAAMLLAGQSTFKDVLLPSVVDSLAAGGLIFFLKERMGWIKIESGVLPLMGRLALSAVCVALNHTHLYANSWWMIFNRDLITISGGLLLLAGLSKVDSPFINWLNWGWLRHIGQVSYGVYIFHFFIPSLIGGMARRLNVNLNSAVGNVLCLIVLAVIVELSWRFIETPALRLKKSGWPRRRLGPQLHDFA